MRRKHRARYPRNEQDAKRRGLTETIDVSRHLSDEAVKLIEKAAKQEGMPVSAFIRRAALRELAEYKIRTSREVAKLEKLYECE